MSLNNTPSGERIHIGIFGRRNAGKSSVINALTGQNLAIVSDVLGTTTDPVQKAMELLPLGPVVMIDTPGLDDEGQLGELRIRKAYQMLNKSDIALLVIDGSAGFTDEDLRILRRILDKNIPYAIVLNKADLTADEDKAAVTSALKQALNAGATAKYSVEDSQIIWVSATDKTNIYELKELIARLAPTEDSDKRIVGDLLKPDDLVVLVIPIDKAAPKGRLILPQQQTIRDILESDAVAVVVKENGLKEVFNSVGRKPALVITDSQVFKRVAEETPADIPFTSFSVLFSRYKGDLDAQVEGAHALDHLQDGDTILISEGCTHHRQCGDIGTEKLPAWIRKHSGKDVQFEFTSGTEFPLELEQYSLIVHCGGCMLNEKEMKYRLKCAADAGIPMTNYGTAIAHMNGILDKSLEIFSK
ncbi:MAG: [Mogibacterium sp.]|nr:[FeFe] hydrogenase H-cluster maturation GTPase HydF [Mogibacterium sp.]